MTSVLPAMDPFFGAGIPLKQKKGEHWTSEEHDQFLRGLDELGRGSWRSISRFYVPSRTPAQVASHAQKYFLKLEGRVCSKTAFKPTAAVIPAAKASASSTSHSSAVTNSTRGEHWSDEEHQQFLLGLKELGKGAWRSISSKYVPTRTPTQVASHSQKYFSKLAGSSNKKRSAEGPISAPDDSSCNPQSRGSKRHCGELSLDASFLPSVPALDLEASLASLTSSGSPGHPTLARYPYPHVALPVGWAQALQSLVKDPICRGMPHALHPFPAELVRGVEPQGSHGSTGKIFRVSSCTSTDSYFGADSSVSSSGVVRPAVQRASVGLITQVLERLIPQASWACQAFADTQGDCRVGCGHVLKSNASAFHAVPAFR